jgi:small conductance mechanosensitive channel
VSATVVVTIVVVLIALLAVALQQPLANVAATRIFLTLQPFRRGELVETMGQMGIVQEILLVYSVLLLPDQRLVSLPNGRILESGVENYSRMGRVWSTFGLTVAYGEDLSRVREVIAEIAARDARVLTDPSCEVVVDELGEIGVRLLVFPTVRPDDYWAVRNDLREQIESRFDAEGIKFAVPPREVHLASATLPREVAGVQGQARGADHFERPRHDQST